MKSFRKIKPTQNNSLIPMMTVTITIMITIGLISSSLVSGALAEKRSPRDVCKINQYLCRCDSLTTEGNARCCTNDNSGRQYCDICDIDLTTGDYINCHPEDSIKFPSQTDLPDNNTVGGIFEQEGGGEHNFDKGSNFDNTTTTTGTFNEDNN